MSEFDLRALLQALAERDIRFVIIGGVAVVAHGHLRATADLDLVPDPDPDNLDRLIDALAALHATLPTADDRAFNAAEDAKILRQGGNVTVDTEHGGLDIVQLA
ncbi:MAG TPA: hypothetical protein VFC52_06335, partial [Solirubrobacterales bacterium]|nr:hypothetical protein [Solirubrobacterales bacterium]